MAFSYDDGIVWKTDKRKCEEEIPYSIWNHLFKNVLCQHELPSESGASVRKPWKAEVWGIVSGASSICPLVSNMTPPAFVDDISQKAEKRFSF